MMQPRIYIDTSVIGGIFDDEFTDHSQNLFDEFKAGMKIAIISDITLLELKHAPAIIRNKLDEIPEYHKQMVAFDEEAAILANLYIQENIISVKYKEDARHIAVATLNKVDILASWNFKHIVNITRINGYNSVNLKYGYHILEIRSPREILEVHDEE